MAEDVVRNASGGMYSLIDPEHPWSQGIRQIAARVQA